ncbi:MAG: NUDIX hydrolase [Phenylobacterium sp.]|uniref:NUDIX hydrolase n=1 Tax=Phenylobacterium sp. TaxID=1871053 RepID=UPI00391A5D70
MRERLTARVLLFDPADRLLLMRGRLPGRPPESAAWFTVGGGVDPGETLMEAARREIAEETGFTEVDLGPVVWLREGAGVLVGGERVLFRESYVVARCAGGEPSRDGWADYETELVDDIRWWSLAEILSAVGERIYPERLAELLPAVIAGDYPPEPLAITVTKAR